MRRHRWSTALGIVILGSLGAMMAVHDTAGSSGQPGDPDWEPQPAQFPDDGKLRILVFGAHPDDAEIRAGGVGAMWAARGHHVKFVSLTNGDVGHWQMAGGPLAQRRRKEVERAAKTLGIEEVEVLDIHDGELMPTLENRKKVVRLIREWGADVVIGHRPNDYHPDHRAVGELMQDAAYMVMVPFYCPYTPHLTKNPVFLYGVDRFQRPNPFRADIVVGIDDVVETKIDALAQMESQFLEGGCCSRYHIETEADRTEGLKRVRTAFRNRFAGWAERFRDRLTALYGEEAAQEIRYAEAFEICEYGTQPDGEMLARLFPFEGLSFNE